MRALLLRSFSILLIPVFLGVVALASNHLETTQFLKEGSHDLTMLKKHTLELAKEGMNNAICADVMLLKKAMAGLSKWEKLLDDNHRITILSETIDEEGDKRTQTLIEDWDNNAWVNEGRGTFSYNPNGSPSQDLWEDWNDTTSTWVNSSRNTYTYDANGNMIEWLMEDWENNAWVGVVRFTYTYNANGYLIEQIMEMYVGMWMNWMKMTFTYDANGNMIEMLMQDWDMITSSWVNNMKSVGTFNANNQLIESIEYDWDIPTSTWVNANKWTYIYNANGDIIEELREDWNGSAWVNSFKDTYTYDANNNRIEMLWQDWNVSAWENTDKWTYTHNANGNRTEKLWQTWSASVWLNEEKDTYTYDANGNLIVELEQTWSGSVWENDAKLTHTYSTSDLHVRSIMTNNFTLSQNYPNPFNPTTTISFEIPITSDVKLVIFNIMGQEVSTLVCERLAAGSYDYTFKAWNLPSGIYYYRLSANKHSEVKSMVVLK